MQTTQQVKAITPDVHNALLVYLEARPYREVMTLITILKEAPYVTLTITPAPKIDEKTPKPEEIKTPFTLSNSAKKKAPKPDGE
jgi:hypothetical protein